MENVTKSISSAIYTYHELNASIVDELHEEPGPLEFLRFVHKNRPFVVRGAAAEWEAVKKWSSSYLTDVMAGKSVQVAVTPFGCVFRDVELCAGVNRVTINSNADAIVKDEDGDLLFVMPHETSEEFKDFLEYVQMDSRCSAEANARRNVRYAQTRRDDRCILCKERLKLNQRTTTFAMSTTPSLKTSLPRSPSPVSPSNKKPTLSTSGSATIDLSLLCTKTTTRTCTFKSEGRSTSPSFLR